jgi:hypothetical protein
LNDSSLEAFDPSLMPLLRDRISANSEGETTEWSDDDPPLHMACFVTRKSDHATIRLFPSRAQLSMHTRVCTAPQASCISSAHRCRSPARARSRSAGHGALCTSKPV